MMSNPSGWDDAWTQAQTRLQSTQTAIRTFPKIVRRIPRIGQLDAELLDEELASVLQDPLVKSLQAIKSSWKGLFELELGLLIRLILYKFSVWDTGATYGAKLQGLKMVDAHNRMPSSRISRRKLLLHAVLTIGLPYLHGKCRAFALSRAWPDAPTSDSRRKAWEVLTTLESTYSALSLIGFVTFLYNGRYRTLVDRLLGLQLVSARALIRSVSYEFMNRQIVWHAITEFLLLSVPLVNVGSLRRRLRQWLSSLRASAWLPQRIAAALDPQSSETKSGDDGRKGLYWDLPESQCAICAERAAIPSLPYPSAPLTNSTSPQVAHLLQMPYSTSCGHSYCYACLTERMVNAADEGQDGWQCLRCTAVVRSASRVKANDADDEDEQEDLGDPDTAEDNSNDDDEQMQD